MLCLLVRKSVLVVLALALEVVLAHALEVVVVCERFFQRSTRSSRSIRNRSARGTRNRIVRKGSGAHSTSST